MNGNSSNNSRIIRPTGALFQADLFLGELLGTEGFSKEISLWKIRPELCVKPDAKDALRQDLNRAGQLSSAMVTHVLDVWYPGDAITVVVEYLAGLSLGEAMRLAALNQLLLPADVVLSSALEIARALEEAHDEQSSGGVVVHGDLRPENVILGFEGTIKLTGFGFSNFLPAASPDGSFCVWDGWCYQPPERFAGGPPDPRSDVFSLGVVVMEAITGVRPWGAREPAELRRMLTSGASPIPTSGIDLPADIEQILRRACQIRPEDRFQTAGELAEALHGLLFARKHTGTSGGLVRQYLGQYLDEYPDLDDDEEDQTIATKRDPAQHAKLLERAQPKPSYLPHFEAPEHPLAGRTDVLRSISQALVGTAKGSGMAILLTAEPGMGRTRVMTEIAIRLGSSDQKRAWFHVKARPAERAVRFSGVLRLLATPVGLEPDCELAQVGRHAERLKAFGLDDQMIDTVKAVAGLCDPFEPIRTVGLLSQALITCISSVAHEQTTIVAWDDLQWSDSGSLACLGELLSHLEVMPVMALLTASSDFRPAWPPISVYPMVLEPLERDDCEDLLLEYFREAAQVESGLLDALIQHTGGSPLLLEEVISLLNEADRLRLNELCLVGDLSAPLPRLEDAIGSRLEQMEQGVLTVLLSAALAGPALRDDVIIAATEFAPHVVRQILKRLIEEHKLLKREAHILSFLHERQRRAVLDAAPISNIEALRDRVARAILDSTAPAEGLDEIAASLLIRTGDPATAAEILFETAEAQEELGDLEGALQRYTWALELARQAGVLGDNFELQLCLGAGRTAFQALRFEEAEKSLLDATVLAERCQDWANGAEAEIFLLQLLARQGRLHEAMERAKDAIPLAEATGDPLMLAQAYGAIGEAYQQWGQYGPDLRYIEAAVNFATESDDGAMLGRFLQLAVTHAAGVGEVEQTQVLLDQVLPLVEENQDPTLQCQVLKAETLLCTFSGDNLGAVKKALEGVEVAHHHGLHELEVVLLHNVGDGNLRLDHPREALYYFSESLRRSRMARYDRMTELNEMFVGYIEVIHLNQSEGIERIRHALEQAEQQGRIWNMYQGHFLIGRTLLFQGQDKAIEHLREALKLAQQTGVLFFIKEAAHLLKQASNQG